MSSYIIGNERLFGDSFELNSFNSICALEMLDSQYVRLLF